MTVSNAISQLVRQARRRLLIQSLLERSSLALACGLACFLLLVVAGTQILRWWWPVLILAGTAAWGIAAAARNLPGRYRVAQTLDLRCGLKDLLSTAFHFGQQPESAVRNPHVVEAVQEQAESAIRTVDLNTALPFTMPRASWAALGLLVGVLGAFGLRYGLLHTFDLSRPLVALMNDPLNAYPNPPSDKKKTAKDAQSTELAGITLPEADRAAIEENERAIEEQLKTFDIQDPDQAGPLGKGEKSRTAQNAQQNEEGDSEGERNDGANPSLSAGNEESKQGGQQKASPKQQEKNSLLDKMRDAMANLMDKLKMDSKGSEPQEASSKSGQSKGEGQQAQNQKGNQNQGKSQQGQEGEPQEGNQPSDADAQNAQMAKGGQMQEPPSNNPKSGVGKSDGNKDTELAEQLEALGKISELLSKRAEKVQGEVMVEVTNTRNQQARTPYSGKTGTHTDAGGELARDEVPLHLQPYVQKYYELVRKPQPAPPSGAKQ